IEKCWPSDDLPQKLEAEGVFPHVVSYGWLASSWLDSDDTYERAVNDFTDHLLEIRVNAQRPLVFIGHGLGGILAKHAVSNTINFGLGEDDFRNPVKLCVFLGVPHHGLKQDDDFASILENIQGLSITDGSSLASTPELRRWNTLMSNTSRDFAQLQSMYGIEVISLTEKTKSEQQAVVPKHAAQFDHAAGKSHQIGAYHQNMAKFQQGDEGVESALETISNVILQKFGKKQDTLPEPAVYNKEDIYRRLRGYDTIFLVDDSDSMEPHWRTTARVLAEIASIAVEYDRNGVDVKFFNEHFPYKEHTNLRTTEQVTTLFNKNTPPKGPTLTADVLDEVLSDYMYEYRKDRNIKGLNLIVLTDGEPEPGQNVETLLTNYARALEDAGAHRFKVGIQFVQIGGDEKARKFLAFIDDELKTKHKLDRDMIDTVYWVEEDKQRLHEKILLGGILKRLDNDCKIEELSSSNPSLLVVH
ncbi:MAG: hypothetical protein Q9214_000547, partial [Letrouitia sp. 1 TL-2023]